MFTQLGKFQIKSLLGSGAMGEVYLAVDPAIGREVAIKTILPCAADSPESRERFAREARSAGTLNHPNIVTVYEFGEDQGVMYIAMEYVSGHDLEELIVKQALTRTEILEVLAQVCDGLDYAHEHHIVHRDIKPANIRVQREGKRLYTRVMDFGIARVGNSDMTATGMVMGTVSYMAPEYIQTGIPDARSDIFAVGVMLYEALSGRKPFAGDTTPTILYKIVNAAPPPLDLSHFEGISPLIRNVLDRGLHKDPEQRFQTAEAFAKALRAAQNPTWHGHAETPLVAPSPTEIEPTVHLKPLPTAAVQAPENPKLPSKSSSKTTWIAASILALVAGGAFLTWKLTRPKQGLLPMPATVQDDGTIPAGPSATSEPLTPRSPDAPLAPLKVTAPSTGSEHGTSLVIHTQETTHFSTQTQVQKSSTDTMSEPRPDVAWKPKEERRFVQKQAITPARPKTPKAPLAPLPARP